MSRRITLAVLAFFLAGCVSGDGGEADAPVPPGTPLEIDSEPRLSIGVVEGDTLRQFHEVVTPFLLPNDRLVVPVAGAREIRVFGPDGDFVRSLGGPGEGPGEIGSLDAAWTRGDTVEAFDSGLHRILRFHPDGSVESVQLEGIPSAQRAVPGALQGGWVLYGVSDAGMGRRDEMTVHRFARDGSHRGVIARVKGMARFRTPAIGGPDPLSPRALFGLNRGEVYVAETLSPRIRVFDPSGNLKREITWEPKDSPSGDAVVQEVVDSAVARAESGEATALRRRLESFPVRERVSAFWDFIVDDEGYLWIRPFEPIRHARALGGFDGPGPGGRWLLITPDGARVGSVEMPDELEPIRITSDAVIGIRRDALGVESVGVHSLERQQAYGGAGR